MNTMRAVSDYHPGEQSGSDHTISSKSQARGDNWQAARGRDYAGTWRDGCGCVLPDRCYRAELLSLWVDLQLQALLCFGLRRLINTWRREYNES